MLRGAAGDAVKRFDPWLAARRIRAWAAASRDRFDTDPGNTFAFIMDVSEEQGLKSALYFIADHTSAEYDGIYSLRIPGSRGASGRSHGADTRSACTRAMAPI